jgi:transposase
MIQITPQMRILLAIEPADFRCGIDGLARLCRERLASDPMSGAMFVFRNRSATAIRCLCYDGQGFWLCNKRLSSGRFSWWPKDAAGASRDLLAHELQLLLWNGDPERANAQPAWRPVKVAV